MCGGGGDADVWVRGGGSNDCVYVQVWPGAQR